MLKSKMAIAGIAVLAAIMGSIQTQAASAVECVNEATLGISDLQAGVVVCPGGQANLELTGLGSPIPLPSPGTSVDYVFDEETGHTTLTLLVSESGNVSAELDGNPLRGFEVQNALDATAQAAVTGYPGCSSTAYSPTGYKWSTPWVWRYNSMYQTDSTALSAIQEAVNLWTVGADRCTGQIYTSSFVSSYAGTTSLGQSAGATNVCSPYDGTSVVGWGNTPTGVLAETCVNWPNGRAIEADVRIPTGYIFYTGSSTTGCSSRYDLRQIVAHEVGHVVGLGHVGVATNQIMKDSFGYCETGQRLLAPGDIAGLKATY